MVRARSGAFPAVVALVAVLVSACGAAAPQTSREELFQEDVRSTHMKNDWLGREGGTSADRIANFASRGTPTDLLSRLLSARPCDADADCPPSGAAGQAVRDFAGSAGSVYEGSVLVKRRSGSLELITLYVAHTSGRAPALVDSRGRTYTGGLYGFRHHNDLLSSDDMILTPAAITSVSGGGKVVAVSGHTATDRQPWLIGTTVVVLLLVLVLRTAIGARAARRRTAEVCP
ncbi:hypothetical protein [Streptomyces sp. NPDC005374]|uniref:hypothetical protein n=1 Tax=Streptomyces sp. NPDC005374 TaxID=3364713 RepID=UPI0036A233B6